MEERPKLGMLSEIAAIECESKLCSCGKEERQEYDDEVKGRYSCIPDRGGKEWRGRGEYVRNAIVEKWKMSVTGCCVALHGIS